MLKHHKQHDEHGFTLLEILMVVLILSVTSMMVAPSFFSASSHSLDDETRRLVQTLRLAQDEAVLSNQTLRITFRAHSYSFQTINTKGEWTSFNASPYQPYKLYDGMRIMRIDPQPQLSENTDNNKEPIMAHIIIAADGIQHIANITLAQSSNDGTEIEQSIAFRPGPGGIRIIDDTP